MEITGEWALGTGMNDGWSAGYERLDEYVAAL